MSNKVFIEIVKKLVADYTNKMLLEENNGEDLTQIDMDNVYIVWISKVLQNNKALAATPLSDGMYYEVTYNGTNSEIYFDAYRKVSNNVVPV